MAVMAEQWGGMGPGGMMQNSGPGGMGMGPGGMMGCGPGMMPPGGNGGQWDAQGCYQAAGSSMSPPQQMPNGHQMPQGMGGNQGGMAMELKKLFLDLRPEEQRKQGASELISRCSPNDAAACVPMILSRLVNFPVAHSLGLYALSELLRVYPAVILQTLQPHNMYDLFNPSVDENQAATFVHVFLCQKQAHSSVDQESGKLQRLLMRRSKCQDLRRVPFSPLRSWLCQIWSDCQSSRPDRQLLSQCCARWIGDAATPAIQKLPCLSLMKQELVMRGRPEGDAWLVSMLLEQVCRDPVGHSPDLQQMLWLIGEEPSPSVLRPLLNGLAEERGRLVTLWVCLCLWVPQDPPPSLVPSPPPGTPPPIHAFLRATLVAFSQFANATELCRTCLLTLAAVASCGEGTIASSSADLLLLLHRDGPLLSSDAWLPMRPILQGLSATSAAASELLQRLGDVMGAPQQYGAGYGVIGGQSQAPYQQNGGYPQGCDPMQYQNQQGGDMMQQQQAMACHPIAQEPPSEPGKASYVLGPPRLGLQNINNTCYMNSFIQTLFMTNSFVHDLPNFKLHLKQKPSVVDKEDHEIGKKIVKKLQRHITKMVVTRHPHTDITDLLSVFPDVYRSGEQQDVTECIRFVFDKLGGFEQSLLRESFAGELKENTQCQVCGNIRAKPETFTDLVLSVPTEDEVRQTGMIPNTQVLLNQRLKFELLSDDNLLHCEVCQKNTKAGKWAEIMSPPKQLCICLNRFTYNVQKQDFAKEKTPIKIDGALQIGPFWYDLYMVIVHTGKDASSGHYYAIGTRAEMTDVERQTGHRQWFCMDDSQLTPADHNIHSILAGCSDKVDDNPYVLFYRCQQAPPTPQVRLPNNVVEDIMREDSQIVIS